MKVNANRKEVQYLIESINESYNKIIEELENERPVKSDMWTADLIEIDKVYLNKNIEALISVLRDTKGIKPVVPPGRRS